VPFNPKAIFEAGWSKCVLVFESVDFHIDLRFIEHRKLDAPHRPKLSPAPNRLLSVAEQRSSPEQQAMTRCGLFTVPGTTRWRSIIVASGSRGVNPLTKRTIFFRILEFLDQAGWIYSTEQRTLYIRKIFLTFFLQKNSFIFYLPDYGDLKITIIPV